MNCLRVRRRRRSAVVGGFFGRNLGKLRILAESNCRVAFYALIPPEKGCEHIYITGTTARFEIGNRSTSNVTDSPGHAHCLWHISPANRTYRLDGRGVLTTDRLEAWGLNKEATVLIGQGRFESRGGIDFFYYRSTPDKIENFDRRYISIEIQGEDFPEFPAVGAVFAAAAKEKVIGVMGGVPVSNSDGEGFSMNFSMVTLFLAIGALGLFMVVIVLIVMLTIRWCTEGAGARGKRREIAEQSTEKLLSKSSDWPQAPTISVNGNGTIGIPLVLTQNSRFDLT
jgi:hypothetical protein